MFIHCTSPPWPRDKASTSAVVDLGPIPAFAVDVFPAAVRPETSNIGTTVAVLLQSDQRLQTLAQQWLPCCSQTRDFKYWHNSGCPAAVRPETSNIGTTVAVLLQSDQRLQILAQQWPSCCSQTRDFKYWHNSGRPAAVRPETSNIGTTVAVLLQSDQRLPTLAQQWPPCQAPGFIGSMLGLAGPVSVYCYWVRYQV